MTFNPDNLIFFYLTGAIILLAISITLYAAIVDAKHGGKKRHR